MQKRSIAGVVLLTALALLLINNVRRNSGAAPSVPPIDERYMVCGACGAEYEVGHDYLANLDPADIAHGSDSLMARCDVCGEIAARHGMRTYVGDGEWDVIGARRRSDQQEAIR